MHLNSPLDYYFPTVIKRTAIIRLVLQRLLHILCSKRIEMECVNKFVISLSNHSNLSVSNIFCSYIDYSQQAVSHYSD